MIIITISYNFISMRIMNNIYTYFFVILKQLFYENATHSFIKGICAHNFHKMYTI